MKRKALPQSAQQHSYGKLVYFAICVIMLYVIVPQLSVFQHSLSLVGQAHPREIGAALGANIASYFLAALTYVLLALKPLRYAPTVLVQIASMFTNRLLPAGIGGMGANFVYLRKSGHTFSQAVSVVGVNNLFGFIGHMLLVALLLAIVPAVRRQIPALDVSAASLLVGVGIVASILLVMFLSPVVRSKLQHGIQAVLTALKQYRRQPSQLVAALGSSTTLTISNLICLWLSARAVDVRIGLATMLLILTFGVALGSIAPTPGGIGGVEAGLVAGLIAYNVPANQALAAVLVFRLINFWFSLVLGAGAFIFARRLRYL